ncbi:DUF4397 domain-containing protein [Pontibacter silvestris]|nr:DUF4397 domain-containing protein [Pontibacter silvestris]MCC9136882.1 DUF4397 domain-containing protein [Pontibacter silvestris]
MLSFSLTGCLDNDNDVDNEVTPSSIAFFYHGSPDAPDLDVLLDSKQLFSQSFKYTYHSNYVSITPGSHRIKFTPVNASNAYIDTAITFKENVAYSFFAVDSLESISFMAVEDSLALPSSGKANVRLINISPDAPAVDIVTTETNSSPLFTDLDFKNSTPFKEITSGKYTFKVKDTESGSELLSVSDITLQSGRIYTLILRGFSSPPSGNTNKLSLQIITNY